LGFEDLFFFFWFRVQGFVFLVSCFRFRPTRGVASAATQYVSPAEYSPPWLLLRAVKAALQSLIAASYPCTRVTQTDRHTEIQTGRQTDRQTDTKLGANA